MDDHPSMNQASPPAAVDLGHSCLSIENYGFNETTNRWAADHILRHLPMAILIFSLMTCWPSTCSTHFFHRDAGSLAQKMTFLTSTKLCAKVRTIQCLVVRSFFSIPGAGGQMAWEGLTSGLDLDPGPVFWTQDRCSLSRRAGPDGGPPRQNRRLQ
jgi:hypothetical protein